MSGLIILGAGGQVGRRVAQMALANGLPHQAFTRQDVDITKKEAVRKAIEGGDFVVNCAAYTAVDRAETDHDSALAINATAPGLIAALCAEEGIPVLHISTDYVFGAPLGRPWREDDPIAPLNFYGESKAIGEQAVRDVLEQHLILRTSWVYDSQGSNFVCTMLRLGCERDTLSVVGDQIGGPTSAEDIAAAILKLVTSGQSAWGTYHFSGAPSASWFEFAQAIFADAETPRLNRITTADYPTPAIRPIYSVLDCSKIQESFGISQPDWHASLKKVLTEIQELAA